MQSPRRYTAAASAPLYISSLRTAIQQQPPHRYSRHGSSGGSLGSAFPVPEYPSTVPTLTLRARRRTPGPTASSLRPGAQVPARPGPPHPALCIRLTACGPGRAPERASCLQCPGRETASCMPGEQVYGGWYLFICCPRPLPKPSPQSMELPDNAPGSRPEARGSSFRGHPPASSSRIIPFRIEPATCQIMRFRSDCRPCSSVSSFLVSSHSAARTSVTCRRRRHQCLLIGAGTPTPPAPASPAAAPIDTSSRGPAPASPTPAPTAPHSTGVHTGTPGPARTSTAGGGAVTGDAASSREGPPWRAI